MTTRQVDRCPACEADALEQHHEPDGDETGAWMVAWFQCARCGEVVQADYSSWGVYVPVVDDEDETT